MTSLSGGYGELETV